MNLAISALAAALVAWFGTMPACGQRSQPVEPNQGQEDYDWKAVAKTQGLADDDIASLEKNKILMTNQAFQQVFSPYVEIYNTISPLPLFITSDSLLNAFHVLLEESIYRLELANVDRLKKLLQEIWRNLAVPGKEVEASEGEATPRSAAKRRARLVIGVALALLAEPPCSEDREVAILIDLEARRIEHGSGWAKPAWLGPPEDDFIAIDYSRYRPRSFYTRNAILERYFRAVSWLQSIPFRVAKDEELLAALLLGHAARGLDLSVVQAFRHFIGAGDDWDLVAAAEVAGDPLNAALSKDDLEVVRKSLRKRAGE